MADMGPRPDRQSLDRYPDPDGPYSPENCRWATQKQQMETARKTTTSLVWHGEELSISAWSKKLGINDQTIHERLKRGWSVDRALSTPSSRD
jgi:hypothetical protein